MWKMSLLSIVSVESGKSQSAMKKNTSLLMCKENQFAT